LTTNYNVLFNLALKFIKFLQSSVKYDELCAVRAM